MLYRITQLEELRGDRLAALLVSGSDNDIKALLNAYFLPHIDLIGEAGDYPYAAFMAEYLTRLRPQGVVHVGDVVTPHSVHLQQIVIRLTQNTLHLPKDVFQSRFELCHLMFFNTMVRWEHGPHFGDRARLRHELADTLDVMAAALALPAQGHKSGRPSCAASG